MTASHFDPQDIDRQGTGPQHIDPQGRDSRYREAQYREAQYRDTPRSDTQYRDTQHDTQHSDLEHSDPRHSDPQDLGSPASSRQTPYPPGSPRQAHGGGIESRQRRAIPRQRRAAVFSFAQITVATCVALVFLQWARSLLIPIVIGIIVSLTLNPLVRRLERARIPRPAGAAVVIAAVWGAGIGTSVVLQDDVSNFAAQMPAAIERVGRGIEQLRAESVSALNKLRGAATAVERATGAVGGEAAPDRRSTLRVEVDAPLFRFKDFLWTGSTSLLALAGHASVVTFLVFFLLSSGNSLKRKIVRLLGSTFERKKAGIRMIQATGTSIQYSLLVMLFGNVTVGIATGVAFLLMGMNDAVVWGVATFILHFVPYFGAAVLAVACAVVAYLQFESWPSAFLVGFVSLAIATVVGTLLTTSLQSRISRIDPAALFVALLVWGWLWGVWGFVLGMPMMAMLKVISDHVERLTPLSQLLEAPRPGEHLLQASVSARRRRRRDDFHYQEGTAAHARAVRSERSRAMLRK